ncbi:MAG: amidohydrolase family protein, partial [Blastocatellia bacterium]|nr:amidohydrolase family protein [Blastocatellia bacterium]
MKIIDTHQHLWDLNHLHYSWTSNSPKLNRSFFISDYLEASRGFEIIKTVHVEADVDEPYMLDETKHILALAAEKGNPLSGVVAAARPEYDNFREYIDQIAGNPYLKGIRRLLQAEPDELSTTSTFIENVRSLASYGLSFDICVRARQLPVAINLVKNCPNVNFILDHCGNPDIKARDYDNWRVWIKEIASYPNVVGKVSGIVVNTDIDNWTVEDLRPAVEHIIESFGWDRVMFGSDWPVCTLAATYKQWVDALIFLTKDAGESNLRKL